MSRHYVVLGPQHWGSGDTLDEAYAVYRRQGGSKRDHHVALRFEPDQDWTIRWDGSISWATAPDPEVVVDKRADRSQPFIKPRETAAAAESEK